MYGLPVNSFKILPGAMNNDGHPGAPRTTETVPCQLLEDDGFLSNHSTSPTTSRSWEGGGEWEILRLDMGSPHVEGKCDKI